MRPLFGNEPRDETGAIVLGDPEVGCQFCGAPAAVHYARQGGKVAWWHPPTDCCDKRRALTRSAFAAARRDHEEQDRAERAERAAGVRR